MENESKFYDGTELLSKMDSEGLPPEIYFVCSRTRSVGKTYWFCRKLFKDYLEKGEKFVLFCRNKLELGSVAEGMFKAMLHHEFHDEYSMSESIQMKGVYSNIYVTKGVGDEQEKSHVGYVIPIASSDQIKRVSSLFSDATQGLFDEFQVESGSFLNDETNRFLSIVTSISRGDGDTRRRFPIYFLSNKISVNNPYFMATGLYKRIRPDTKFCRMPGLVYQGIENEEIIDEHANAGINRAFKGNEAIDFASLNWMNDNYTCVEKPGDWGRAMYYCTILCNGGKYIYGVNYYPEMNLYYVGCKYDKTAGLTFNITYDDMTPNIPLIRSSLYMRTLKSAMEQGIVRFQTIRAKESFMDLFL